LKVTVPLASALPKMYHMEVT